MQFHVRRPSHATVVAYVALFVAMSGTAAAATGGTFLLGKKNTARATTVLSDPVGTPLKLRGPATAAPLKVTSRAKVARLNADQVDGLGADELVASAAPRFYTYGGQVPALSPGAWAFLGDLYVTATVKAGARVTGVTTVGLEASSETVYIQSSLCWAPASGGTVTPFRGETSEQRPIYHGVPTGTGQDLVTATGTVVPGAGTWRFGYCLKTFNAYPQLLSNGNNLEGWFMVTAG